MRIKVGECYRTKLGVKLKVIALAKDAREKDRRVVVFLNKETYRDEAPGEVWTSGVVAFERMLTFKGE